MKDWIVRRAHQGDAKRLVKSIDAAYALYKKRIADLPAVSEGIPEYIGTHRVWVAEVNGLVVGGIVLILENSFATIANLAVEPDYNGMGLGKALMSTAENECRNLGMHEIRLKTHVLIPENVRLYEHLGWVETGRTKNTVAMSKSV